MRVLRAHIPLLQEKSLIVPKYKIVRKEITETLVAFCLSGFFIGCGVNMNCYFYKRSHKLYFLNT